MGNTGFLKQLDLTDFARIRKAGLVVGKDPAAGTCGGLVERRPAPLGQNHGGGLAHGGPVLGIRIPSGTQAIHIALVKGMEGKDHGCGQ